MEPIEWLKIHRAEIVEHWKHRVRPLAREAGGDAPWEKRIDSVFEQVCVLIAEDGAGPSETEVEAKLFKCAKINEDKGLRFSANLLSNGRRAIGDVSKTSGDAVALRCAEEWGNVIDYLEHSLRMNICHNCNKVNCCMRVQSFEAIPGGTNE